MLELLVEPVAPVVPEFGLDDGVVLGAVLGVVLLVVPGVDETLPLTLPVPVAPIEDVEPGAVVVLLVVVSVLLLVLPVDAVLGVVALPVTLPEPVVVDGVVDEVLDEVEPVPLAPVVLVSALRWQALSERTAATAIAAAVSWVFIRNSLGAFESARAAATALR